MAKAKNKKKKSEQLKKTPNLKFRKQARLTIAAVLLVMAVLAALIPPGDIDASTGMGTKAPDVWSTPGYDNRGRAVYPTGSVIEDEYWLDIEDEFSGDMPDLNRFKAEIDNPATGFPYQGGTLNPGVKPSYTVRLLGNDWVIGEEFYYGTWRLNNDDVAIIYAYNDSFFVEELILDTYVNTGYEYLFTQTTPASGVNIEKDYENFLTESVCTNPIVYGYGEYELLRDPAASQSQNIQFIKAYIGDYSRISAIEAVFSEYYDAKVLYDSWQGDPANNPNPDPGLPPTQTLDVVPRTDFAQDVGGLYEFYCDQRILGGAGFSGFTLTSVGRVGGGTTLIIRDADDNRDNNNLGGFAGILRIDPNGFLNEAESPLVYAIGYKVFSTVGDRVHTMDLPGQLAFVGDSAFEGANMLQTINLQNLRTIGNRTFKGCSSIRSVNLQGVNIIGAEAFYNASIQEVEFRSSLTKIGAGAFAAVPTNSTLQRVNMMAIGPNAEVEDYAFFGTGGLSALELRTDTETSAIKSLGKACFALPDTGNEPNVLTDVVLPGNISGRDDPILGESILGDWLFQGRTNLRRVTMPGAYGSAIGEPVEVPPGMFRGCQNLEWVRFPSTPGGTGCGFATFRTAGGAYDPADDGQYRGELLFLDVNNPEFVVYGPGSSALDRIAAPRRSTWYAYTSVNDYIPYIYQMNDGSERYEVSMDGTYVWGVEVMDTEGVLTSCILTEPENAPDFIDLRIPATVGKISIIGISDVCLAPNTPENRDLRPRIRTVEIADNSLSSIAAGAFSGLESLRRVIIGNSVREIGASAFGACPALVEVTLNRPNFDFAAAEGGFSMAANAFFTTSPRLVMNGIIDIAYEPFALAIGYGEREVATINSSGVNILYRSLAPQHMTVMYDHNTNEAVLVNYPMYNELDKDNETYRLDKESRYYSDYSVDFYEPNRRMFMEKYNGLLYPDGTFDPGFDTAKLEEFYEDSFIYGPWMNPAFVNRQKGDNEVYNNNLFPYYEYKKADVRVNAYSILENHARSLYGTGHPEWLRSDADDLALIAATEHINIPAGITSIDTKLYFEDVGSGNMRNKAAYFDYSPAERPDSFIMITDPVSVPGEVTRDALFKETTVPGLFSGYYDDNVGLPQPFEPGGVDRLRVEQTLMRGNDRILSVSMNTVKRLPNYAFDSCERLEYVVLGQAMTDIGKLPFRNASSLRVVSINDNFPVENGIIYSHSKDSEGNPTGHFTIEQVVSNRGNQSPSQFLDNLGVSYYRPVDAVINSINDPRLPMVNQIADGAFQNADYINDVNLYDVENLERIPSFAFHDCDQLGRIDLPTSVWVIGEKAFVKEEPYGNKQLLTVYIPRDIVNIHTDAFINNSNRNTILTYEGTSAAMHAVENNIRLELIKGYRVEFIDYDGTTLSVETIPLSNNETPGVTEKLVPFPRHPGEDPTHHVLGWVEDGWRPDERYTTKSNKYYAQYADPHASGKRIVSFYDPIDDEVIYEEEVEIGGSVQYLPTARTHPRQRFNGWKPADSWLDVQRDTMVFADYSPTGSTPDPNASPRPSSSPGAIPTDPEAGTFTVTVSGGSGSGRYVPGSIVTISAYAATTGRVFDRWTTTSTGVGLLEENAPVTIFTMPGNNVVVTATYRNSLDSNGGGGTVPGNNTGPGGSGGGSGSGGGGQTTGDGNVRVDITLPGIPNRDMASATVTGALDNFVLRITEDPAATTAVTEALTKQYGDISDLRYVAMDISLYDATGTQKITDTSGLSLSVTLPLPTAQLPYGGSNRVISAIGGEYDRLTARFSTIDGVPVVTFSPPHFSPYGIYADLNNLDVAPLDITPKTGDGIHPKWFLVVGFASMSAFLFLKKERIPKLQTA